MSGMRLRYFLVPDGSAVRTRTSWDHHSMPGINVKRRTLWRLRVSRCPPRYEKSLLVGHRLTGPNGSFTGFERQQLTQALGSRRC